MNNLTPERKIRLTASVRNATKNSASTLALFAFGPIETFFLKSKLVTLSVTFVEDRTPNNEEYFGS